MNFKSFLIPILFYSVSLFYSCFPLTISRSTQAPPQQHPSVAYKGRREVRATSNREFITEWRQQLETHANQKKLELNTLKKYRIQYSEQKPADDFYISFIESKKGQIFEKTTYLEKHHILPRFEGGGNEMENLIFLTPEDHRLAHFLRYLEYGKLEDASVVLFRCGYNEEAKRVAQKTALAKMKRELIGWWNPIAQSERGQKGGKKGGSANTQAQFEARQAVGKQYGHQTGIRNQGSVLKEIMQYQLNWVHDDFPGRSFVTTPSRSGKAIINQLEKFVPNQIKNDSSFYKVLKGERSKLYGWKLVGKEIRSEAEGGEGPSERSETST